MKYSKERIYGFAGSTLFCLFLLLVLYLIILRTEVRTGEEGVLVNFGNLDSASGTFEPQSRGENRQPVPEEEAAPPVRPPRQTEDSPEIITRDDEQTVALQTAKKEAEKRKQKDAAEAEQRLIAEARRKDREERRQREAIDSRVSGAFGAGTSDQSNQGTADAGSGNQGDVRGNSGTGIQTGAGGYGEFALDGRSLGPGGLPKPSYSVQEEGRIVINVIVDPKGNVILAEIGRGTNIDHATMRRSALEAAKKAKFNAISGSNNQSGTITYKYNLK